MRIGADYYPEHWQRERWEEDARLMKKAGIQVIRIGEFAWSLYEPEEGNFKFEWMDEAIEYFGKQGISIVLGTPSATPPKWMIDKYPDILPEDIHGNVKLFGSRKHYCFNNAIYREKTRKLVSLIAERYGCNPYVEGWQIDNELGHGNTTHCFCENCRQEFIGWLKGKYKTIDNLNQTYGTVFWSQTYNNFDQLILPRAAACYDFDEGTQGQNPSLYLDYYRFCSDSIISFTRESVAAIRKHSDKPCSSNLLDAAVNSGTGIDYFELSKELDYVTWDNYIEFQWGKAKMETVSRDNALLRSYKKQPFWVMEQQSGPCGWSRMGPSPDPGKIRLWSYEAVANGADTIVYFRWRACTFGTEQNWHGILGHDGKENRRYAEIAQTGREMQKLSRTLGPLMPQARVAIIKSFTAEWCHTIFGNVEGFQYDNILLSFYKAFYGMGLAVDFVSPEEELNGYNLVLAPALAEVSDAAKENLTAYAETGGILLITFRSGFKDQYNRMLEQTIPGPLTDLTGIEVNDYDPQFEKETSVNGVFGSGTAHLWCDIIAEKDAEVLGVYTGSYYTGSPCLTRNGNVYYLGCDLDDRACRELMKYLCSHAGIDVGLYSQKGVETIDAEDGTNQVRFILNHNDHEVVISYEGIGYDLLKEQLAGQIIRLKPYDVAVIQTK